MPACQNIFSKIRILDIDHTMCVTSSALPSGHPIVFDRAGVNFNTRTRAVLDLTEITHEDHSI